VNNFSSFSSSSFSKQFFSFLSSSAHSPPEEEDAAALTTKDERAEEERAARKNEEENVFLFGKLLFVVVAEETEEKRAVVVIFFYRFCGGGLPSFFTHSQRPFFISLFSLSFARRELQIKRESSLFAPLEPVRFPLSVRARRLFVVVVVVVVVESRALFFCKNSFPGVCFFLFFFDPRSAFMAASGRDEREMREISRGSRPKRRLSGVCVSFAERETGR